MVFDHKSSFHTVSKSRGEGLSVMDGQTQDNLVSYVGFCIFSMKQLEELL